VSIQDILFDKAPSYISSISKQIVDWYRIRSKASILKVDADAKFRYKPITVKIDEYVTLNLLFLSWITTQNNETTKMLVINLPGKTIIVGLPNIMSHYHDLLLVTIEASVNRYDIDLQEWEWYKNFQCSQPSAELKCNRLKVVHWRT
jgi:hypothetical protein